MMRSASSSVRYVIIGSSGPKISCCITGDSGLTFASSVGAIGALIELAAGHDLRAAGRRHHRTAASRARRGGR